MCCRGRHCGAACVVVSQWLAQHFATCRCFRSLSREEAGSHDSIMAMEEGQTIAEAGKLDKFPYEASTAAASRWSGKPRPQGGPCRQIWRHRPDCHCNRQGMLERFLCKAIVAASSRRRGPCRQIWDCHRHRQGMLEKFLCKAIIAASSRRSLPCRQISVPRPDCPCRQIWAHHPDCHCHRQGKLERFLCKAIVAAS